MRRGRRFLPGPPTAAGRRGAFLISVLDPVRRRPFVAGRHMGATLGPLLPALRAHGRMPGQPCWPPSSELPQHGQLHPARGEGWPVLQGRVLHPRGAAADSWWPAGLLDFLAPGRHAVHRRADRGPGANFGALYRLLKIQAALGGNRRTHGDSAGTALIRLSPERAQALFSTKRIILDHLFTGRRLPRKFQSSQKHARDFGPQARPGWMLK